MLFAHDRARTGATLSFLAALVAALMGMSAPAYAAGAQATFVASFADMVPGETRSAAQAVTLPTEATLTVAEWDRSGHEGFAWQVRLCGAQCRTVTPTTTGMVLAPGDYRLEIAVTAGDVPMAAESGLTGRLVWTETADDLATTGTEALGLGVLAAGLTGLGFWLVLTSRRREEER